MSNSWYQDIVTSQEPEIIPFSTYDMSIHNRTEQLKRRINATRIKSSCIEKTEDGYFIAGSSGTYHTTLDYCTCFDYLSRSLPCKHIYRLAVDSGIIEAIPKVKPKDAKQFESIADEEANRFFSYYEKGWISAEKYVRIVDALYKGR